MLDRSTSCAVTLSGLAGVGKTRIARHIADHWTDAGLRSTSDEIVWVDANDPSGLVVALLDAIGAIQVDENAAATVGATLDSVPRLIVIDRADRADGAATILEELIRCSATTRWLITSRTPLHFEGEQVVRVEPFDATPGTPVETRPGVQIFFDVAARFGQRWSPEARTLADIAAIVDRLGGLPAAIELAASRSVTLSPATIRHLLDENHLDDVVIGGRAASELFAAVGWSVSLLEPAQEQLLRDMSVFGGAVTIEAIADVTSEPIDEVIERVGDLIDVHLVDARHGGDLSTFALNPLVRQHTLSDEIDADLEDRHTRWAVAVAAGADSVGGVDPLIEACGHDLLIALRRSLVADADGADDAAVLAAALAPLWLARGVRAGQLDLMRDVAAGVRSRASAPAVAAPVIAWTALLAADRAIHDVQVRAVIEESDAAVALCRQCDLRVQLEVLSIAVRTARVLDERAVAIALCDEGIESARTLGDDRNLARFEIWSGMLAHQELRVGQAADMARSALERARRVDEPGLVIAAAGLLHTLPVANDPELMLPPASELVEAARRRDDRRSLMWLLPITVAEALRAGDIPAAATAIVGHLSATRSTAAWNWATISMSNLSSMAETTGDVVNAARFQGMLATHWPVARRGLPPAVVAHQETLATRLRAALGDSRFEAIAGSGALLSFADAVTEAIGYAQSLAAEPDRRDDVTTPDETPLTEREEEILARLITGETNKQIAALLGITPKTVMHHTSSIYRKLGVRGRAEAVAWGVRRTSALDA